MTWATRASFPARRATRPFTSASFIWMNFSGLMRVPVSGLKSLPLGILLSPTETSSAVRD